MEKLKRSLFGVAVIIGVSACEGQRPILTFSKPDSEYNGLPRDEYEPHNGPVQASVESNGYLLTRTIKDYDMMVYHVRTMEENYLVLGGFFGYCKNGEFTIDEKGQDVTEWRFGVDFSRLPPLLDSICTDPRDGITQSQAAGNPTD